MASYEQCISEPNPTHPAPPPHSLTPAGWEESAGFRETFLYHVTEPDDAAALRRLARILYESTLELARYAPPGGESATREELRAAVADLRHTQGFLAAVARSQEESELSLADAELAALAARQAQIVAGAAAALEQALGRPEAE
jgi:predicted ArsR family transcriptional regulator